MPCKHKEGKEGKDRKKKKDKPKPVTRRRGR